MNPKKPALLPNTGQLLAPEKRYYTLKRLEFQGFCHNIFGQKRRGWPKGRAA
jgi:hypothetical protein